MIKFASICPHPPIIIPDIGQSVDLKLVKNTINAMEKLADEIVKVDINTVLIISPHGVVYPDRMNISYGGEFAGDFSQFDAPEVKFDFLSNNVLAEKIVKNSEDNGININRNTENEILDHGVLVPMYYLSKNLPENVKIIPINYSLLSRKIHFQFGEVIGQIGADQKENIAIIASGDLSHRLFQGAPAGFDKAGKEFDKKLIKDLKANQITEILNYDEDWVEAAGECGYRSILILLGALSNIKYKPEILSYEGPFGVGYLVANFKLD